MRNHRHGMRYTKQYRTWRNIKNRCLNPNHPQYYMYGGRGITVCDRWLEFANFWEDVKDIYSDTLEIDRIDNNKGYELGNCRWTTRSINSSNRRTNVLLIYKGDIYTMMQLSQKYNINFNSLWKRIKHGRTVEQAIETPINEKRRTRGRVAI